MSSEATLMKSLRQGLLDLLRGRAVSSGAMTQVSRILCWTLLVTAIAAATGSTAVVAQPTQPIYVQYDGFVRNKDGTLTLSFGYYNMNNVDVPVAAGAANAFAPAPGDRNQPVVFLKGRHRFAC